LPGFAASSGHTPAIDPKSMWDRGWFALIAKLRNQRGDADLAGLAAEAERQTAVLCDRLGIATRD
jgi:hypothetical protein